MKIGIIGGGIVGETVAFYLSKHKNISIDLYDDDWVSGTKAAVGIVCPWVNQRRNKSWYKLVEEGANFYQKYISDLETDSFVSYSGCLVINDSQHDKLFKLAQQRAIDNPLMGDVKVVDKNSISNFIPRELTFTKAIDIPGAFQVDGSKLLECLKRRNDTITRIPKRVVLTTSSKINNINYDYIIITAGAGINDVLKFDNFTFDYYSQKGMLIEFDYPNNRNRIIMPKGEIDILFKSNKLIIGASHENNYKDLKYDKTIASQLISNAEKYITLPDTPFSYRIGLRGQNSKNMPFYGYLNKYPNIIVAGGLGSSGLTSGPIIGYKIADFLVNRVPFNNDESNPNLYIGN